MVKGSGPVEIQEKVSWLRNSKCKGPRAARSVLQRQSGGQGEGWQGILHMGWHIFSVAQCRRPSFGLSLSVLMATMNSKAMSFRL